MSQKFISHREKLQACLNGELSGVPVAFWRHFPVDDQDPDRLIAAQIQFQNTYNFDFVKISPSSSYCLVDWGIETRWSGNPEGTRDYLNPIIQKPQDWEKLKVLDPNKGALEGNLRCIKTLCAHFSPQTPVIATIFSPMAQAKNLAGRERLLAHMRQYPDAVLQGLQIITQSIERFVVEAIKLGIDGVFYAIQHGQHHLVTANEFNQFQWQFDQIILEHTRELWLNVGHLHGENVLFEQVKEYPFAILNWHDRQTAPTLSEAQKTFNGAVCGGIRQWDTLVYGTAHDVTAEAKDAILSTYGRKFILGSGCVVPVTAPHGNLMAAIEAAHSFEE